jgi:cell wall-associated NlpC family hydrolase
MSAPPEWINRYIGTPHVTNGRTPEGFDCWGLMMAVWRDQRQIELPDFQAPDGASFLEAGQAVAGFYKEDWRTMAPAVQVDAGADWDFVAVVRRGACLHMGLLLGGGVLHSSYPAGTVWEPENRFNVNYPKREYWRWLG